MAHILSMIVAMPWPPPMHMVMSAVCLPLRSSSSSAVPSSIAPVAPNGWPERDRAAVNVDQIGIDFERPSRLQHDAGEGSLIFP